MIQSWLASPYRRIYPKTPPSQGVWIQPVQIALNERFSFQLGIHNDTVEARNIRVSAPRHPEWNIRIRRVGYIPVRHLNTETPSGKGDVEGQRYIPGFVPDPLFDEDSLLLPAQETHSFWFSVSPSDAIAPGKHTLTILLHNEGALLATHHLEVYVYPLRLQDVRFSMTHWLYIDALMDWYRTDGLDERFWEVLKNYLQNMTEHGMDTVYVPIFTPPLDGVKRPSQLLHITSPEPGRYQFDWSIAARFVRLAKECGFRQFEWTHLFTQWGAKYAIRVYHKHGKDESLLWAPETEACSDIYRNFLKQFLPELHNFLQEHEILGHSYFHISDEPAGEECLESYKAARSMIADLAPWMHPIMDALSEIEFAKEGLVDLPVASISTATQFVAEDIESWCYYCCIPRQKYLNRLLDTPLSKIAMHGILFYRWPFKGFLHWGYNYWYRSQTREMIDPFTTQDAMRWPIWPYGDPFVVYPGPDGPIDSIRWEVFSDSMQDYALLQTLGINRDDPILKTVQSFERFPKTEDWRQRLRERLFQSHCGKE